MREAYKIHSEQRLGETKYLGIYNSSEDTTKALQMTDEKGFGFLLERLIHS